MNLFVLIENFLRPLAPLPRRVYNLGGSSAALFLSMRDGPFIAVEATEEASRQLFQDMVFFRKLLHRDSGGVCFLPPGDGPEVSGQRARAVCRLALEGSASSLVTSSDTLNEKVWEPWRLKEIMLRLRAGDEAGRDALEQRLIQLDYSRVPLVTERGQYSLRGYIMDVFPSDSGGPFRLEFMGDEIEGLRAFDVETQRSVGEVAGVELLPAREPSEGIMPGELLMQAEIFYSESVQWEPPPEGAVALSRYRIEGEGADAGHLQLAGLGVLPAERKDIYGLPDAVSKLMSSHRVLLVGSSSGQAERLREVFSEKGLICPLVELERAADYRGNLFVTVGGLSAGIYLPGLLVLTEREMFGGRPAYRPMRKSRVSGLLTNVDDLRRGDYVVHADRGVGRFEGLVHQKVEGYGYDLLSLLYEGGDRLYIPLNAIDRVRKYHAGEGAAPRLDSLGTRKWRRNSSGSTPKGRWPRVSPFPRTLRCTGSLTGSSPMRRPRTRPWL
jgi:transcription-repair coupling factor (superfamily II helicase)